MDINQLASMSAFIKQELAPLAEKLGQGVEFTYGIFIKQVWVEALQGLIFIPLSIIVLIGIWKLHCFIQEVLKEDNFSDAQFLYIPIIFVVIFCLFGIIIPLYGLIQVLINPDYQAIKLIFETIKSVK
jgi:hypothetical protein